MTKHRPDWQEFEDIPDGTVFYTRRGLPYEKIDYGCARQRWSEDDPTYTDDDHEDGSAFEDWPYWKLPT